MTYVAVITGASSGIGEATARLLAERQPDSQIVLVARRQDRIDALAADLNRGFSEPRAFAFAVDLSEPDAAERLSGFVERQFGLLHLLVNNAGARWSQNFSEGGYANVAQTMAINFEAQVRLTEALLPLLRAGVEGWRRYISPPRVYTGAGAGAATEPAPVAAWAAGPQPADPLTAAVRHVGGRGVDRPAAAIVNVASTAARVSRPATGAYSASKAALLGWSDALRFELATEGIHVGVVNPGFIATEGFPATELRADPVKRLIVSTPEKAAEAVLAAGLAGRAEVFVPRFYWLFAAARLLAPGLIRRAIGGGGFHTGTTADAARAADAPPAD